MFVASASITVRRPIEGVFTYLADLEANLPRWASGIVAVARMTPRPDGPGTRFQIVARAIGRPVVSDYLVTLFEPPTRFGGSAENRLFGFTEQYTLRSLGDATAIDQRTEVQPHGLLRLVAPLMALAIRRLLASDLERLKALLEAPSGPPTTRPAPG